MMIYILLAYYDVRFDIRGLSPGSPEDEAGVKEASELCENICMYSIIIQLHCQLGNIKDVWG